MFCDIRRICETQPGGQGVFPDFAGNGLVDTVHHAMQTIKTRFYPAVLVACWVIR